jgi:hypothetical protein
MDAGTAGLIGVVVGSTLALAKDWFFQQGKDRKDVILLAIQISAQLEHFAAGCASVSADNGEEDERGFTRTSVPTPEFDPNTYDVEWKQLAPDLLLDILDLPYRIGLADGSISESFDMDDPPDYWMAFEERQYAYAVLGIEAADLAVRLRTRANIRSRSGGRWDPVAFMKDKKAEIEASRRAREARAAGAPPASAQP